MQHEISFGGSHFNISIFQMSENEPIWAKENKRCQIEQWYEIESEKLVFVICE